MNAADLENLEIGQNYRVVTADGEELTARVVALDIRDKLFVYDIVESNKAHTCEVGHILRFADVTLVQHLKND